jgi:pimeloyl-ACP methyl ester carboxylesterase
MERGASHSLIQLAFAASVVVACGAPPPARDPTEGAARVPRNAFVDGTGGVRLHYLDFGGNGEPLMLLAGAGDTAWIYLEFGADLSRDHRVLALTRRGFGDSDAPQSSYDLATLDADLVAVLDAWNIPRVTLIGHSLAGSELTHFAVHHPARVRALVYLEAAYDRSAQEAAMADAPDVYVPPTVADRASIAAMTAYLRRSRSDLARYWTPAVQRNAEAQVVMRSDGTAGYRQTGAYAAWFNSAAAAPPEYERVTVPVLAIYANEDESYQLPPASSSEAVAEVRAWQAGPQTTWRNASIAQLRAAIPTATVVEMTAAQKRLTP